MLLIKIINIFTLIYYDIMHNIVYIINYILCDIIIISNNLF